MPSNGLTFSCRERAARDNIKDTVLFVKGNLGLFYCTVPAIRRGGWLNATAPVKTTASACVLSLS